MPPAVALTNPPPGFIYVLPAIVRLKATAVDADGSVKLVEFYDSTNLLGSVAQPPYNLFLTNVLGLPGTGPTVLTAVAIDDQGASSTSTPPVTVYFSQAPRAPQVSITQPKEGDVLSSLELVSITANVVAYDGTENPVYFFSDGQPIGSVAPPPYTLSVSNLPPGEHLLSARYTDWALNTGNSVPVRIAVKPFSLLAAQVSSNGQFGFAVQGLVAGNYFEIEGSADSLNWFPLSSNIASSNSFHFVDPTPASLKSRFYRGLQQLR